MAKSRAVFYLSTGRAGSGTFAHLFQQSKLLQAFHVPSPEMVEESFIVQQGLGDPDELFKPKLEAIRSLVGDNGLIYVETNPRIAFFIDQLNEHFDAKFIWIIRDPVDYVNSGLNRKWFTGAGGIWDKYRESPLDSWPEFWGGVEKITWQWCCINSLIENKVSNFDNVRVAHFSDIIGNPEHILDILHWAGGIDISISDVKSVMGLNINVGRYSAPRDARTGDHIFGQKNQNRTVKQDFDQNRVVDVILNHWNSIQSSRYLTRKPNQVEKTSSQTDPRSYREWLLLLKSRNVSTVPYRELIINSDEVRSFLRHDIDLFDEKLINDCRRLEEELGFRSTWFFLPPKDKRYSSTSEHSLQSCIRDLRRDGHEIGYHVNAWEVPGTFCICEEPLKRLDEDIEWFSEALGEPLSIAVAHGIPHHKKSVSNFSMFDSLRARNVLMLDQFVIRDGGAGRRIPHFDARVRNPVFPTRLKVSYASDSGGPIRKDWNSLDDIFQPPNNIIINTHCGNYPIDRDFDYIDAASYSQRFSEVGITKSMPTTSTFDRFSRFFKFMN